MIPVTIPTADPASVPVGANGLPATRLTGTDRIPASDWFAHHPSKPPAPKNWVYDYTTGQAYEAPPFIAAPEDIELSAWDPSPRQLRRIVVGWTAVLLVLWVFFA